MNVLALLALLLIGFGGVVILIQTAQAVRYLWLQKRWAGVAILLLWSLILAAFYIAAILQVIPRL